MEFKYKTLEGIARTMGASAFKNYAHDYGNSRVSVDGSVAEAIACLYNYGDGEDLITHFNGLHDFPELIWKYKDLYN